MWPSWSAIREEQLNTVLQAEADIRYNVHREASLVEEIASVEIGVELSVEEDDVVDAVVALKASEWFEQKQSRLHVAFIALHQPRKYDDYFKHRIEEILDRQICCKRPKPDYYPFKPEHVAENKWGTSKM